MARQNVGNPKFYIDLLSYWWMTGNITGVGFYYNEEDDTDTDFHMRGEDGYRPSLIGLNPTEYLNEDFYYFNKVVFRIELKDGITLPQGSDKFFFGLLGHSLASSGFVDTKMKFYDSEGELLFLLDDYDGICNINPSNAANFDGWSLAQFTNASAVDNCRAIDITMSKNGYGTVQCLLGSICFGNLFEMSHSPDLNLTINRSFEGINNQTTIGGSTLTQVNYYRPPDWAGLPAWELIDGDAREYTQDTYKSTQAPSRGRRSWSLSFSYISSDDLFAINENIGKLNPTDSDTNADANYSSSDFDSSGSFISNISESSSFLAVLMNNTMGGALPFIFQPDGNNNSPDQFAICRISPNSFSLSQVANNTYNVSMTITETW